MTPAPTLQELIETVRSDSAWPDPLAELGQAAKTVGEIEQVSDALLGHFVDRCRRSGSSWSEISTVLGVSKQAAHKRFAFPISTNPPSFERFTPRARAVLKDAALQAARLGHRSVGTEHLLLALFQPDGALAAQVLAEAGLQQSVVEEMVLEELGRATPLTNETTPFSLAALDALRLAVVEALKLGHNYIGTEHLLLALFDEPTSPTAKMLAALGASYDSTADRLHEKFEAIQRLRQ